MHGQNSLELFSLIMDFILIAVAIWMASTASQLKMGGAIGKTVNYVVSGSIVLGLAHLIETLFNKFNLPNDLNEVVHRGIILVGFVLLAMGIRSLVRTLGAKR